MNAPLDRRFLVDRADHIATEMDVLVQLLLHLDGQRDENPALADAARPVLAMMRHHLQDLSATISGMARNA